MRAKSEVVVLLACEARQIEDDDEVNASLVCPAVLQESLELGAVRRLGALPFLLETLEYLIALTTTVLLARAELGRKAEILCLLLVLTRM
jgi:hypothetical protein